VRTTDDGVQTQFLTCQIADEEYGIGIMEVREILQYETMTRVPNVPPFVRGVINLRGSVVPVVDLALKFGQPARQTHRRTCIIIVETASRGGSVFGILADSVSEVIELHPGQIKPPPDFGTRAQEGHLRGMGSIGNRFVLLLAPDRILGEDDPITDPSGTPEPGRGLRADGPPRGSSAAA